MVVLNLIPYHLRRAAAQRFRAETLFFGIVISTVVLFGALYLQSIEASLSLSVSNLKTQLFSIETTDDLRLLSRRLMLIKSFQGEYALYADRIADFARLMPQDIEIETLRVDGREESLSASGSSPSLAVVSELKRRLEASGSFAGVNVELRDVRAGGGARFFLTAATRLPKL